jgi:hypothetical protein
MPDIHRKVAAAVALVALAVAPIAPALADGHGYGHGHGWGLGRGVVGAAVALAVLPLVIASEVLGAGRPLEDDGYAQDYRGPAPAYYAQPEYYARPPSYYGPPVAYYGEAEGRYRSAPYYSRPRGGPYGPGHGYDAPRSRHSGSYGDRPASRPDDRRYLRR